MLLTTLVWLRVNEASDFNLEIHVLLLITLERDFIMILFSFPHA